MSAEDADPGSGQGCRSSLPRKSLPEGLQETLTVAADTKPTVTSFVIRGAPTPSSSVASDVRRRSSQ